MIAVEPLDLVSVVLRAAAFIAALQAAGLAWFAVFGGRVGVGGAPAVDTVQRNSALLGMVLVLTHRGLDAARLAGEWTGIVDLHLQGMVWGRRPGLSSLMCVAGLLAVAVSASSPRRWGGYVGPIGALVVAGSFALTGHTTEASHALALQSLVAAHVGLAAYWTGAVAGLHRLTCRADAEAVVRAATRFSATAVWLVPLILPVGAFLIWGLLPGLAALRTPYGGLLMLKVLGFSGLILLAAWNRFRCLPAISAGTPGAVQSFRRVLRAEYVLLSGVLAATATMTSLFSWH